MFVFGSIAIAGFVLLLGGALLGHDHDVDHDVDHDHDGDHGDGDDATVSIFSTKVIATFIMGFGAGGAIASHYGVGPLAASGVGIGVGFFIGLVMYGFMRFMYSQQATSLVKTEDMVGKTGTVTTSISGSGVGEVDVDFDERRQTYLASSASGKSIGKNAKVKVILTTGGRLIVDEIVSSATTSSQTS